MLLIFSGLYLIFRLAIIIFAGTFLGEIMISFTPYWIVIDLIVIFLLLVFLLYWGKKKYIKHLIFGIVLVSCLFGFFSRNMWTIRDAYFDNQSSIARGTGGLRFRYANIYKDNTDYQELQHAISSSDPDVVLLVEYEQHHHTILSGFFAKHYLYRNRDVSTKEYFGNIIFSKYPLEDLTQTIEQIPRRYGMVRIHKGQQDYLLYLVHTSAPVSMDYFDQRTNQLKYVGKQLQVHTGLVKGIPAMIIGDFNLSPWSVYYRDFMQSLPSFRDDVTMNSLRMTTWCERHIPIACVHIDHIFHNQVGYLTRKKFNLHGSDHDGFEGILQP